MDVMLYHFYYLIFWLAGFWFFFKFLMNAYIHNQTDSYINNLVKNEGYGQFGSNDQRWTRRDRMKTYEQWALFLFTTWWDLREKESPRIKRIKKIGNVINILSIFIFLGLLFLFLYMQDVNHKYRHIKRDPWQYFPDNKY